MSSILRALKKLENDPRHLEENQPLDSKFVPLADTTSQKTSPNIFMAVFGGGIVCGLVLLAGWWLLADKAQTPQVPQQKISEQNLQQQEQIPAAVQETKNIQSPALAVEPSTPSRGAAVSEKIRLPDPEPTPVAISEPTAPVIAAEAAEAPIAKTVVAKARPPVAPTKTKEIEIPVLRDPEMKLQAITWSKDPQKRIVVINNRILREGETVRGYRIETINQDDIILGENGEKWKFIFHIK